MKSTFLLFIAVVIIQSFIYGQGKYAGSKKSLIGQVYTDYLELPAFKGWTFMEGGVANSLSDPEMITSNVFKKGTSYVVFFSIREDTASGQFTIVDAVEIKGVQKGWTVRSSFCRQNKIENNYIIAWGKETTNEYIKLIRKAWRFNPDKRRIEIRPVKGIDCMNIGC